MGPNEQEPNTIQEPNTGLQEPNTLDFQAALTLAVGQFDVSYAIQYHDYRRADVTTKVTIPKER